MRSRPRRSYSYSGDICEVTGKQAYTSPKHAKRHQRGVGNRLRTYRCKACGHWHTTAPEKHGGAW